MKTARVLAFAFSAALLFAAVPAAAESDRPLLREACDFMFDDACTKTKEDMSEWWGRQKERYRDIKEGITGTPGKVREGARGWADRIVGPFKGSSMTREKKRAAANALYARWGSLDAETRGLLRQGWQPPPGREPEGRALTPEEIEAKRLTEQMSLQEYVQRSSEGESPYAEAIRKFKEEEEEMKSGHTRVGDKCYYGGERIGCAVRVGGAQDGGKCFFGGAFHDCGEVKVEAARPAAKKEPRCFMDGEAVDCAEKQRLFREANPELAERYEAYQRDEMTEYAREVERQLEAEAEEARRETAEREYRQRIERQRREAEVEAAKRVYRDDGCDPNRPIAPGRRGRAACGSQ